MCYTYHCQEGAEEPPKAQPAGDKRCRREDRQGGASRKLPELFQPNRIKMIFIYDVAMSTQRLTRLNGDGKYM